MGQIPGDPDDERRLRNAIAAALPHLSHGLLLALAAIVGIEHAF